MIKFLIEPSTGPFRNTTPEALLRRCADEVLTPRGAADPFVTFVIVQTGFTKDNPMTNDEPLTMLTLGVNYRSSQVQVELLVDEKTWRNALRAALAEIDDGPLP